MVVEANPSLLPVIDANRRRNDARFSIVHGAIAYGGTTVWIRFGTDCLSTTAGHPEGDLRVPALTLRDLFADFPYDGCVLVCDIEGSETDLVANEVDLLKARVATLVLEEHPEVASPEQRAAMFDILRDVGFTRCAQRGDSHVLRNQWLTRDAVSPDREPVHKEDHRRRRQREAVTLGILLLFMSAHAAVLVGRGEEDAYISYRYASNLVSQGELVYNSGERVEGFSNLSWTLALASLYALGIPLRMGAFVMAIGCAALALGATYLAARRISGTRLALLPVAAFACCSTVLASFGNGLEGSLWCAALTLAVTAAFTESAVMASLATVFLITARPEGFAMASLVVAWSWYAARSGALSMRGAVLCSATAGCTLAALLIFRELYFGDWLPNSVRAKMVDIPLGNVCLRDSATRGRSWGTRALCQRSWRFPPRSSRRRGYEVRASWPPRSRSAVWSWRSETPATG